MATNILKFNVAKAAFANFKAGARIEGAVDYDLVDIHTTKGKPTTEIMVSVREEGEHRPRRHFVVKVTEMY